MFDIGNAKYAAKYKKSLNAIKNYVQREYKGEPEIEKAWRDLVLPTITCLLIWLLQQDDKLIQERSSYGNRKYKKPRRRLHSQKRTRNTLMHQSLDSAPPSWTAEFRGQADSRWLTRTRI